MRNRDIKALPQADAEWLKLHFPKLDRSKYFWSFCCFSRQNYGGIVPALGSDEIYLSIQCIEGGCLNETIIRWHMLGGKPVPRLEMFNDAWPLLQIPTFVGVLDGLAELIIQRGTDYAPTPDEVSALLIAHGFTDQSDWPLGTANG